VDGVSSTININWDEMSSCRNLHVQSFLPIGRSSKGWLLDNKHRLSWLERFFGIRFNIFHFNKCVRFESQLEGKDTSIKDASELDDKKEKGNDGTNSNLDRVFASKIASSLDKIWLRDGKIS